MTVFHWAGILSVVIFGILWKTGLGKAMLALADEYNQQYSLEEEEDKSD